MINLRTAYIFQFNEDNVTKLTKQNKNYNCFVNLKRYDCKTSHDSHHMMFGSCDRNYKRNVERFSALAMHNDFNLSWNMDVISLPKIRLKQKQKRKWKKKKQRNGKKKKKWSTSRLSDELEAVNGWLIDNKLSLHLGKTESILFGRPY